MKKYTAKYATHHPDMDHPIVTYGMFDHYTKRGARKMGERVAGLMTRSSGLRHHTTVEVVQVLKDGSIRDLGQ